MLREAKRHRPEAGQGEQPEAGRPVGAGQAQIGQQRRRREAVDDILWGRVGDRAGFAFGQVRGMSATSPPCARNSDEKSCTMASKLQRLFVKSRLRPEAEVELEPAQAHYLINVLRCKTGDEVLLFNGEDGEWRGAVSAMAKKKANLVVASRRGRKTKARICTISSRR